MLVQAILACGAKAVEWACVLFATTCSKPETGPLWSIPCAVILGFVFSYFANTDKFHKWVRDRGWSKETAYPSEWFGASNSHVTYVVLRLEDGRRSYGWPREWPSEPLEGHFEMEQATWLTNENEELDLTGVDKVLIDARDVKPIEFMKKTWENSNG